MSELVPLPVYEKRQKQKRILAVSVPTVLAVVGIIAMGNSSESEAQPPRNATEAGEELKPDTTLLEQVVVATTVEKAKIEVPPSTTLEVTTTSSMPREVPAEIIIIVPTTTTTTTSTTTTTTTQPPVPTTEPLPVVETTQPVLETAPPTTAGGLYANLDCNAEYVIPEAGWAFGGIAEKCGYAEGTLLRCNPDIQDPNLIITGVTKIKIQECG